MSEESARDLNCTHARGERSGVVSLRGSPARLFALLLLTGILTALVPAAAVSKDWQRQSYEESPIKLRLDWPWLAGETGTFAETWNARYSGHLFYGSWVEGRAHRLEVMVERLAPMYYWKHVPNIRVSQLEKWKFLEKTGIKKVRDLGCGRGSCLAFEASYYSCAGFLFVVGPLGTPNDGGADEGGDIVGGYYCVNSEVASAARDLDRILEAIVIVEE